jgi:mRNA-degrading endonuclease RelE of RelBE toxin-antitoxin system
MVNIDFNPSFEKTLKKIKNIPIKNQLKKQIAKIIENPEAGKPMRYGRKGTRELYVAPFRLSYAWAKDEDKIIFLDLYHKDEQ